MKLLKSIVVGLSGFIMLAPAFAFAQNAAISPSAGSLAGVFGAAFGVLAVVFLVILCSYIFAIVCMFKIGDKVGAPYKWLSILPITLPFFIALCAKKSAWWGLPLLALPVIGALIGGSINGICILLGLAISIYLWMTISELLGHAKWLGALMWIPGVNFILGIYFAFADGHSGSQIGT